MDCTWASDAAAFTQHATPEGLMEQAKAMMREPLDNCAQYGLRPNLKKHKTMAVFTLRCKGAHKVAAKHFAGNAQQFEIPSRTRNNYHVHIANGYVHLGTYLEKSGDMSHEFRRRLAMANSNFELHKRTIYQSTWTCGRQQVFKGSVSLPVFNLELWTPQLSGWQKLQAGYQRLQRKLLVGSVDPECLFRLSDAEVQYRRGGCPPLLAACQTFGVPA